MAGEPESAKPASDSSAKPDSASGAKTPDPATAVVDDARASAAGIRSTARWIAAAIAGIPTLALVTTLLKPPEGSSFEPWLLVPGVILAIAGALYGIIALGHVFEPVPVEDADLTGFRMGRVAEAVDDSYTDLVGRVRNDSSSAAMASTRAQVAHARADVAQARATVMGDLAKQAEAALAANPSDAGLKAYVRKARERLLAATDAHASASGYAAAGDRALKAAQEQLANSVGIRRVVFALDAGDTLRGRYTRALGDVMEAGVAVATGIALVLLASQVEDKDQTKTAGPETISVVTLNLNPEGKKKICPAADKLTALKLTNDKKAPIVITFPTPECPAKKLPFVLEPNKELGQIIEPSSTD
jgi:hypothetical protein